MMKIQKNYNNKIIGKVEDLSIEDIERHTQQLALCAHAELSSLVNATNFKKHHGNLEPVDRDNILYESIDVLRYVQAIQNLWQITPEEIESAFCRKSAYLDARHKIDQNPWHGEPVAIVDVDDVLADFRESFASWLSDVYKVKVDTLSEEYYFIDALVQSDLNPEAVFERFTNEGGFSSLGIVDGAKEMVQDLKQQGYWVQILTARPESNLRCLYDTYFWLKLHDIAYDDVAFSSEKFRWCAKSKYYDSSAIKFAIDDSPKHASEYAKHGIHCWVPEKSYNKEVWGEENITTYDSLDFIRNF